MKSVEILAPAGSYESMFAAINAGADAVYMGGSRFGARAYADNPEEEQWLFAIDYAHLHGCKLYMTVNTLVKEEELGMLYEYLLPYYQQGLDAVIVQDPGVFSFIKRQFPSLPIHASTQMTITGCYGAALLKEMGASRVVTARELGLSEIAEIRDKVDIEIESFVHGALCYCYSGQCLLSSLIGGRSGNRGRCAQPCRLPYEVWKNKEQVGRKQGSHVLSMKDLCTLDLIPDLLEAGVCSMKIEGRMKSPRYTAGTVSIYRKYVDRYLTRGRDGYEVKSEDRVKLLDLFDRGGLTEGYYRQHNGKYMVAFEEKPAFRTANQELFDYLDETYVNHKKQEPIGGYLELVEGKPSRLDLWIVGMDRLDAVSVSGAVLQSAKNQPLDKARVETQFRKTGNTPFVFDELQIKLEGACFMSVQEQNELRRRGLNVLEQRLYEGFRREAAEDKKAACMDVRHSPGFAQELHVSIEDPKHLGIVLKEAGVKEIYIDSVGFSEKQWGDAAAAAHQAGKNCLLVLPHIFRKEAATYFTVNRKKLEAAGFDGLVVKSLDAVGFLREQKINLPLVFDFNLYGMNHLSCNYYESIGAGRQTVPVELNSRELETLGCEGKELIVYGYLPVMVSAQCVEKNTVGCGRRPGTIFLKDRMGKRFPVKNHCRFCYNTIYNSSPLSLLGMETQIKRLCPSVIRMQFTIETSEEIEQLLSAYTTGFLKRQAAENPSENFTRGHMKRGIE